MNIRRLLMACLLFGFIPVSSSAVRQAPATVGAPNSRMTLTVSMDHPSTHYFHVQLKIDDPGGDTIDVRMPVWTPGYYLIMDYEKNVLNFRAEDEARRPISWEKTAKNSWRLRTGEATAATVTYDVYAFSLSEVDSYLDDERTFKITPAQNPTRLQSATLEAWLK